MLRLRSGGKKLVKKSRNKEDKNARTQGIKNARRSDKNLKLKNSKFGIVYDI